MYRCSVTLRGIIYYYNTPRVRVRVSVLIFGTLKIHFRSKRSAVYTSDSRVRYIVVLRVRAATPLFCTPQIISRRACRNKLEQIRCFRTEQPYRELERSVVQNVVN